MAADVVERAHNAIVATDHEHGRRVHREREEIAGIRDLEREPREDPALPPDLLHLGRIQRVVEVERPRHSMTVAPQIKERLEIGAEGRDGAGHRGFSHGLRQNRVAVGIVQRPQVADGEIAFAHRFDLVRGVRGLGGGEVGAQQIAADRVRIAPARDASQHAAALQHDFAAEEVDLGRCTEPRDLLPRPACLDGGQRGASEEFALVRRDAEAQTRLVRVVIRRDVGAPGQIVLLEAQAVDRRDSPTLAMPKGVACAQSLS